VIFHQIQLSLTNCATHLCKCNDVADLTSIINIYLKKIWFLAASGLSKSLKVIGTDVDRSAIYDFLLVFYSNFVLKTHHCWDILIQLQKCCDLENQVRRPSRSLEMSPFDTVHTTLSGVVSEIFNVKKCDLEIRVRGHSRSLIVVIIDRLPMVSY